MLNVKVGMAVRDIAHGTSGYILGFSEHFSGQTQWHLVPTSKDGERRDGYMVDAHHLEESMTTPLKVTPAVAVVDITLGNEVKDITSGATGIATSRYTHINGCISYTIVTKEKPGSPSCIFEIDQNRVGVVGVGIAKQVVTKRTNGGKSVKFSRGL